MDKTFNISVKNKRAKNLSKIPYVCGNKDYRVAFDFDDDWNQYPIKTARFVTADGTPYEETVIDNQCKFPQIMDTFRADVGVYAGDLVTTTPAVVECLRSIRSGTGATPEVPEPDRYDQMMEAINADALRAEEAANAAEEKLENMQERYYTPNVDEDGNLTWEPNADDMPDLPPVNIKGPEGSQEIFVVRRLGSNGVDKTYAEIEAAIEQNLVVLLVVHGETYNYIRTTSAGMEFCRYYNSQNTTYLGIWESRAVLAKDGVLTFKTFTPAQTPNPRKLKFTGAVSAEYDGSSEVTVEIPEGGGGSGLPTGGEPHQMLVTDAEGNATWEKRTHWEEKIVLLPETQVAQTADDSSEFPLTTPFSQFPQDGEAYTVNWNGVEYSGVVMAWEMNGIPMAVLGNAAMAGVDGAVDNGHPYVIGAIPPEYSEMMGGAYGAVMPLDGSTSATISVTSSEVHKIPDKFINLPIMIHDAITLTLNEDGTFTSDTPFATAYGKDELTLARSIRVVCPADVDIGDMKMGTESYYTVSNVSKGTSFLGSLCIRCEIATYIDLSENDMAPVKIELVWHGLSDENGGYRVLCFWKNLPQLRVVNGGNSNKNPTLYYSVTSNSWEVNYNHSVDESGNGWFAGTVEGTALILSSPDGSRWQITVDDTGALATVKL